MCVKLHPKAELSYTLANNVAVLKLDSKLIKNDPVEEKKEVEEKDFGVVDSRIDLQRDPRSLCNGFKYLLPLQLARCHQPGQTGTHHHHSARITGPHRP